MEKKEGPDMPDTFQLFRRGIRKMSRGEEFEVRNERFVKIG